MSIKMWQAPVPILHFGSSCITHLWILMCLAFLDIASVPLWLLTWTLGMRKCGKLLMHFQPTWHTLPSSFRRQLWWHCWLLFQDIHRAVGLAVDMWRDLIFWTDIGAGHQGVYRASLDGSKVTRIIQGRPGFYRKTVGKSHQILPRYGGRSLQLLGVMWQ